MDKTSRPPPRFEVAIVGGGVCGLTCAVALQRAGVSVQIFEQAPVFSEIGAGLGVGPNAVRILRTIGILDDIMKKINPDEVRNRGFKFYDGLSDSNVPFYEYSTSPEDKGLGIHRAVFLDALVDVVDPKTTHFNKRCTLITESNKDPKRLVVHFQDGTIHETDVVLGADGIKSSVRNYIIGEDDKRIQFSNTVAYRGLIPYNQLKEAGFNIDVTEYPVCLCGPDKHFILFSIKDATIINVVCFAARYDIPIGAANLPDGAPWVELVPREVVEEVYAGWGPNVAALMKCMPENPSKWSIHVLYPPLESYAKGNVAVLGDAAHAMLPHLGAGAGQGIEDAYVLARLLSHPDTSKDNIEALLVEYSRIRKPRTQMVWQRSRNNGQAYDMNSSYGPTLEGTRKAVENQYEDVWHHDIDADIQSIVNSLRASGVFPSG